MSDQKMPLLRKSLYKGEDSYFNENPDVAGMAAEDGSVVLNPYSTNNSAQRGAVYQNEASRLYMRANGTPSFSLTEKQQAYLNSNSYKDASDDDRRATVLARIISGDSSAGDFTDEQRQHADAIKSSMDKAEYSSAFNEATEK
jgi:hypothetical protein